VEDFVLSQESFLARIWGAFVSGVRRNKTAVKAIALTFVGVIFVSIIVTVFAFSSYPQLADVLQSFSEQERRYIVVPPPYTETLYFFILSNNIGHFWNPIRMLVWAPLLGTLFLGIELLLNGVLIGVVATVVGIQPGVTYPILGLVPHGIFEIPAFILEFASIIRWQVTIVEAIMDKVTGEKVNVVKLKLGVKDAVVLAVASVVLFVIAAFVETYVTPSLLGL
jgi:uncharacterized membrane protein SpoIIM required for sporulation